MNASTPPAMTSPEARPILTPRGPGHAECQRQAEEVLNILMRGGYAAPSGATVDVAAAIRAAIAGTVEHPPDEKLPAPAKRSALRCSVRVVDTTSLAAARELAARGATPMVLNFASAHSPGGGFLRGARAQEESLARSSALYACIEGRAMYAHHGRSRDPMYTSWMIWSPNVPVFRDEDTGRLLEAPFACAFLTAAAPNARVLLEREPGRLGEVERAMRARVARSLEVARAHGHTHLVLGAWGCGVFGNDPVVVADAYHRELEGEYAGVFEEVVFAVLDDSADRQMIGPFAARYVA